MHALIASASRFAHRTRPRSGHDTGVPPMARLRPGAGSPRPASTRRLFDSPGVDRFSVGTCRLRVEPLPFQDDLRLFRFLERGESAPAQSSESSSREVVFEHHLPVAVPGSSGARVQAHRGRVLLVGQHPDGGAPPLPTEAFELLDQGARDTFGGGLARSRRSRSEEFGSLVRMEDLDRGDEARRSIVDVAEQQHVAVVGEEPRGLLRDDGVVERLLEPSDLARRRPPARAAPGRRSCPQPTLAPDSLGRRRSVSPAAREATADALRFGQAK